MKRPRGGFTFIEAIAASIVLAAVMLFVVQALAWNFAHQRGIERQQLALQEVSRVLDRLSWEPWDRLTPERASLESLSRASQALLPGAVLNAEVTQSLENQLESKRILVAVRWPQQPGSRTVALAAWKFRSRPGEMP